MKVCKDWTIEQAWAAQEQFQKEGGASADPTGPFNQWVKLQALDGWERAYKAGNKNAVLEAIADCALAGLALPDWLARAYLKAWRSVRHYKSKSWDEAFGKPHASGANLNAMRKQREKSIAVWTEVDRHRRAGKAINDMLFAKVGRKYGIGLTLTKEYYSEWKQRISASPPPIVKALLDLHLKK